MDTSKPEYQRALDLDKIFKFLGSKPNAKPSFFSYVSVQLRMDEKTLGKLLREERRFFELLPTPFSTSGDSNLNVYLTEYGKEKYDSGWTFMKQLEQDAIDETQRRKQEIRIQRWALVPKGWNIILGTTTILFAFLTWDATRENKIHDAKEERWEVEKRELQSQIQAVSDKYYTIPDSVRRLYEKPLSPTN